MSCENCAHCRALAAQSSELSDLDLAVAIVALVGDTYHVPAGRMRGRERTQHVAFARMVGMYLTRRLTHWTFPAIATFYHRDHSTVIAACNRVLAAQKARPMFAQEVARLIKALEAVGDGRMAEVA